jgi:uncharacterized membrane protein
VATTVDAIPSPTRSIRTDTYEKLLSVGAIILGVAMGAAIIRGHAHWREVPLLIWLHLLTIAVAIALTPTMLLSTRGTTRHRWLGRVWAAAMLLTAALTFGIHGSDGYSVIHLLSAWTLLQVPLIWWTARTHRVVRHRRAVRGMVTGALLVAGFFTFPFDRLLGNWLFG